MGTPSRARRSKRRPLPAVLPDEQRNALLLDWLDNYASDLQFRTALQQFADHHAETIQHVIDAETDLDEPWSILRVKGQGTALPGYSDAVKDFVTHWQLHLLPDQFGYYAVHSFCMRRRRDGSGPEAFTGPQLSQFFIFKKDYNDASFEAPFRMSFYPEVDATLTITHTDTWQTSRESQKEARTRILKEIIRRLDRELNRIAVAHEDAGYIFADTAPERRKYLRWLYMKDVLARSTKDIADAEAAGDDPRIVEEAHIDNKIRDMRKALGFPTGRNSIS